MVQELTRMVWKLLTTLLLGLIVGAGIAALVVSAVCHAG